MGASLLTFDGVEEILHAVLVQTQRLGVVLVAILLGGLCHQIDGLLQCGAGCH